MAAVWQPTRDHPALPDLLPRSVSMTDEMTRKPKAIRTAATSGTLMVPATNLPQYANIYIHATFVAAITGQWSAPLQPQSLQGDISYAILFSYLSWLKLLLNIGAFVNMQFMHIYVYTCFGCWSASAIYFIGYSLLLWSYHDHYLIPSQSYDCHYLHIYHYYNNAFTCITIDS